MMALHLDENVFRLYAFYAGILVAKMLLMIPLTVWQRFAKRTVTSPEDISLYPGLKAKFNDEDVERVRRAHRNDLENILQFLAIAFLYCFTSPDPTTANFHFGLFTGGRFLHTLVYAVFPLRQPARGVAFFIGYFVSVYITLKVIAHFYK